MKEHRLLHDTIYHSGSKNQVTFKNADIKLTPMERMDDQTVLDFEIGTDNYVKQYFQLVGGANTLDRFLAEKVVEKIGYGSEVPEESLSSPKLSTNNIFECSYKDYSDVHDVSVDTMKKAQKIYNSATKGYRKLASSDSYSDSTSSAKTALVVTFYQTIEYYSDTTTNVKIYDYMDMTNPCNQALYLQSLRNASHSFDNVKTVEFKYAPSSSSQILSYEFVIALGVLAGFVVALLLVGVILVWDHKRRIRAEAKVKVVDGH